MRIINRKPVSPQKAVRRFKFIMAAVFAMCMFILVVRLVQKSRTKGYEPAAYVVEEQYLQQTMDRQLDSLVANLLPEGTVVTTKEEIVTYQGQSAGRIRLGRLTDQYNMLKENKGDPKRLLELKEQIQEAKRHLDEGQAPERLYTRFIEIHEPDSLRAVFYQITTNDLKDSYIIRYFHSHKLEAAGKAIRNDIKNIEDNINVIN